jgi:hypothetical protein
MAAKKNGAGGEGTTEALAKPVDQGDLLAAAKRCLEQ